MKFSIIIPAYNSQDYIANALISVKQQKFTDYELIVVCDSCTDFTKAIAEQYADKVIEVNYHNDGLSRQAGMDAAEGDWLLFMDDDDKWMHPYVLEFLNIHCVDDFDIVAFGFIFGRRGVVGPMMTVDSLWPNVWSKAWRAEYAKRFRFENVPMESDFRFCAAAIPGARISLLDAPLYIYNYMRKGSQTELKARRTSDEREDISRQSAMAPGSDHKTE